MPTNESAQVTHPGRTAGQEQGLWVAAEVAWARMQPLGPRLPDHRGSGPDLPRGLGRLYLQAGLKPMCAVLSVY